jgi:hypothetical protein
MKSKSLFNARLFMLIVVFIFSLAVPTNVQARRTPKHYKGYIKERKEFQKRNTHCRNEQYRIQGRYK